MFGSDMLEVATGVVFVFVLISTLCTSLREGLEGWFKARAAFLEFGIRELLQDKPGVGLAKQLFDHPLIFGLYPGNYAPGSSKGPSALTSGNNLPSYIPSRNFALALLDIAARGSIVSGTTSGGAGAAPPAATPTLSLAQIRSNVASIKNPQVERVLFTAIDAAQGDFERACTNLEHWYDSSMDRVSGWYKRSTQWVLFWIALVVAIGLNINTITIADYLYRHDAERQSIVSTIDRTAAQAVADGNRYDKAQEQLGALRLPMGWSDGWGAPRTQHERRAIDPKNGSQFSFWQDVAAPVLGWLFTAFAAMLGAPFWFDVLNRIMVIRSTVKPHEKSGEEASMDHQERAAPQPVAFTAAPPVAVADVTVSNDTCGVGEIVGTPDDQLPPATGGVIPT
jgi:hypothetical protein